MYDPLIDAVLSGGRARRGRPHPLVIIAACLVALAGAATWLHRSQPHASAPPQKSSEVAARAAPARPAVAAQQPDPAPVNWVASNVDINVAGRERNYRLVRPATAATGKLPILVVLHGRLMTPIATQEQTGFLPIIGPAIVAYPAGFEASWNAGACCAGAHASGIDDVSFVTAIVKQIEDAQPDASRTVYLVGYSNGGRMAYRLACEAPGMFSGVAAVEAASVYPCPKPAPVPLLMVASTDDPLLRVDDGEPPIVVDGFTQESMTMSATNWANSEGCHASSVRRSAPDLVTTAWTSCAMAARVELAVYQGGSHGWPEGNAQTPSAQRVIWRFFHPTTSGAGTAPA